MAENYTSLKSLADEHAEINYFSSYYLAQGVKGDNVADPSLFNGSGGYCDYRYGVGDVLRPSAEAIFASRDYGITIDHGGAAEIVVAKPATETQTTLDVQEKVIKQAGLFRKKPIVEKKTVEIKEKQQVFDDQGARLITIAHRSLDLFNEDRRNPETHRRMRPSRGGVGTLAYRVPERVAINLLDMFVDDPANIRNMYLAVVSRFAVGNVVHSILAPGWEETDELLKNRASKQYKLEAHILDLLDIENPIAHKLQIQDYTYPEIPS